MTITFLPQAAPEFPGNALLNFGPLQSGIRSVGNALRAREETEYSRAMDAKREARAAASHGASMADREERKRREAAELFGKQATAIAQMDPAKRAVLWPRILARHPDAASLDKSYRDPATGPELVMAEAGQYSGQGADYGKTGTIFTGPDGQYYAARWAADGTQKIAPVGPGMTPARGVAEVDTGTGTAIIDKATGQDVRTIGKDVAGAEHAKVIGRETGEGQMQLPKAATGLQQYELQDDAVNTAIDKAISMADGMGATGLASQLTGPIGGTPAYNLARQIDTIKGNIGFDKLQNLRDNSPTGGALGQVAVQELQMLQSVLGSLDQAQDSSQLKTQMAQIKDLRAKFRKMKREAYQRDVARFGAGRVPNPEAGPPVGSGGEAADPLGIRQ